MKKGGVIVFCLAVSAALLLVSAVEAQAACQSNQALCSANEVCEGTLESTSSLFSCCIGTCVSVMDVSCENVGLLDIFGKLKCELKTKQERAHDFIITSPSFMLNWINKFPPIKPYEKLWNFWYKTSFALGVLILLLSVFTYYFAVFFNKDTPQFLARFRSKFVETFFAGLILIVLPHTIAIAYQAIDYAFTLVVRIIVPDGDILSIHSWITTSSGTNLFYLVRDLAYFLFGFTLVLRYAVLWVLMIFVTLFVVGYVFMPTERYAKKFFKLILTNLTVPILWILVFVVAFYIFEDFSNPIFAPLFIASILYANIKLYRWFTGIDFSFVGMLRKTQRMVARFISK